MRYIAKVLKNSLHKKFPDASEDELLKVESQNVIFFFFFTSLHFQRAILHFTVAGGRTLASRCIVSR